jgi:hypothetical protein
LSTHFWATVQGIAYQQAVVLKCHLIKLDRGQRHLCLHRPAQPLPPAASAVFRIYRCLPLCHASLPPRNRRSDLCHIEHAYLPIHLATEASAMYDQHVTHRGHAGRTAEALYSTLVQLYTGGYRSRYDMPDRTLIPWGTVLCMKCGANYLT